jgi:hypothetical protein
MRHDPRQGGGELSMAVSESIRNRFDPYSLRFDHPALRAPLRGGKVAL